MRDALPRSGDISLEQAKEKARERLEDTYPYSDEVDYYVMSVGDELFIYGRIEMNHSRKYTTDTIETPKYEREDWERAVNTFIQKTHSARKRKKRAKEWLGVDGPEVSPGYVSANSRQVKIPEHFHQNMTHAGGPMEWVDVMFDPGSSMIAIRPRSKGMSNRSVDWSGDSAVIGIEKETSKLDIEHRRFKQYPAELDKGILLIDFSNPKEGE